MLICGGGFLVIVKCPQAKEWISKVFLKPFLEKFNKWSHVYVNATDLGNKIENSLDKTPVWGWFSSQEHYFSCRDPG